MISELSLLIVPTLVLTAIGFAIGGTFVLSGLFLLVNLPGIIISKIDGEI